MSRIVLLVGILLLLAGCAEPTNSSQTAARASSTAPAAPSADAKVILVLGDSLSAAYGMAVEDGWVALLQHRLAERGFDYRIVNASQSGATSDAGLAVLPRALSRHEPDIVIIELGANDGLRGLPLQQVRDNLESMVEQSQTAGATVVLTAIRIPPNYGVKYTETLRALFPEIAERTGAALIPQFIELVGLRPRLMQADRVHPNEQAQPILLDAVWETLEPLL